MSVSCDNVILTMYTVIRLKINSLFPLLNLTY